MEDSTATPIFFVTFPPMKPRMLRFCHFVASAILVRVGPPFDHPDWISN